MKIAVISFTRTGYRLSEKIAEILRVEGYEVWTAVKCREIETSISYSLAVWTREQFRQCGAVIFVGAVGIAVRAIAPCIRSKTEDPAVLAVDETGRYCIPILSGHLGGANALARFLAERLPAEPVITTATDSRGKWAVDVFAAENKLTISDMTKAKEISAKVLRDEWIGFLVEGEGKVFGELPQEVVFSEKPDVVAGIHRPKDKHPLCLIPKVVTLGIGCRKGISAETIEKAVGEVMERAGIFRESVEQAASIDKKAGEEGLLSFCRKYGLDFRTYSAKELLEVPGEFSGSGFVERTVGVDNVCERSAVKASGGGKILVRKQSFEGVTVSLAVREWSVQFE